jgi:hypothetical protein
MSRRSMARFAATVSLSYCLSIFLFVFITGVILLRTVLNPWYVLSRMERSDFAEQSVTELSEVFITYGLASGVSPDVMTTFITADIVNTATEAIILETFGRRTGYSSDEYINEITDELRAYAIQQGFTITTDIGTGLHELAVLCADALKDHINSPIFGLLARLQYITRYIVTGIIITAVLSLTAIIIIPTVNLRVTRWIDGYIYALGATSLLCIIISIVYYSLGISTRLTISPLSYNRLISSWFDGIINSYMIALLPLLSALTICITIRIIRRIRRNKQKIYAELDSRRS